MKPFKHKKAYKDKFIGEHGYFNFDGYLKYCLEGSGYDTDGEKCEDPLLMILAAERNMGKTYGTGEGIHKEVGEKHNYEGKIAYIRTNLEKIKSYAKHFNSKGYEEKKLYYMTDKVIYKCFFDENGEEDTNQRKTIGYLCSINNADNFRSGDFGVKVFFWDEYNEHEQQLNLFQNFDELMKTVERQSTPFLTIMVGNKVNSNNQIIVKLEIEPMFEDLGEDYIEEMDTGKGYIDISKNTFDHIDQKGRLANGLASFDRELNRYMNEGGHLEVRNRDVIIGRTRIAPTAIKHHYVQVGENYFEFGEFINPGTQQECYYFHKVYEDELDYDYKIIAADKLANISNKNSRALRNKKQYERFAQSIARAMKYGNLFYDDPDVKILVQKFVLAHLQ